MSLAAVALLVVGSIASLMCHDFRWLSRFGALVICAGIIILARPAILGEDIKTHIGMAETGLSHLDPEHYRKIGQPVPDYVIQDLRSRTAVGWLGPLFCFLGTATNGFGDLLNGVFGYAG